MRRRNQLRALTGLLGVGILIKKEGIAQVFLTRRVDRPMALVERRKYANQKRCDLFVSLHTNASRMRSKNRIEVYYSSPWSTTLAQTIGAQLSSEFVLDFRIKDVAWTVLWDNWAPLGAVLVETMYLTHRDGERIVASEQGREQIAASLFLALKEVLSRMPPQPLDRATIQKRSRTIYGGIIDSAKMGTSDRDRVTAIVEEASDGVGLDKTAIDELIPLLYSEMRRLAQWHLGRFGNHTLQATAVVHEAYLKLVDQKKVNWRGRAHFLAVASKVMRNLLIDEARKRTAQKRGGGWQRVTMAEGVLGAVELNFDELLHLDAALSALEEHDRREAIVVELRFFGGLRVDEVAEVLGVSKRTAEECWTHARAWLRRELSRG